MPKILHLGFGNFHRAHQAWYTQRANALGQDTWSILGVSMRRAQLRDALAPYHFDYTLALRGREGTDYTAMQVHEDVIVATEDPEQVIAACADPAVQIITLTVTEKGYGFAPDGTLDLQNRSILDDLQGDRPQTAVGLLAHGLARRSAQGTPITVISCDNLSDNGHLLRAAVSDFANAAGLNIADYLSLHTRFPNTMVDRITPATTQETVADVEAATGRPDPSPVVTEVFSEWIIEDTFAAARPAWEQVGAVFTDDVAPFEARKLRMLNASHSLLAYGGLLRGHDYVHQAIQDPELRRMVNGLWDEAESTLPPASRAGTSDYRTALAARFEVPEIRHALRQIAMDGSLKIPVRVLSILNDRLSVNLPSPVCIHTIAAWIAFLAKGNDVSDPQSEALLALCQAEQDIPHLRRAIVAHLGWTDQLSRHEAVLDAAIRQWLE